MARIRTVKPELFSHEDLYDAEKQSGLPLRLAFIGLFTCADREGRFKWRPRTLKLDVLPHDEDVDFADVLDALCAAGFVVAYDVDGARYGFIPSFSKHQVVNMREAQSTLPAPEEGETLHVHAPVEAVQRMGAHVHAHGEGKGREGKGKEGKESDANASLCATAEIFEHWQTAMNKPRAVFDDKRRKLIRGALAKGYTADDLRKAIDGCKASAWHMGENERGKPFNTLELILRDAEKIDAFMGFIDNPTQRTLTRDEQRANAIAQLTGRNRPQGGGNDPYTIDV